MRRECNIMTDQTFQVDDAIREVFLHDRGLYLVEEIIDLRVTDGRYEVLCRWAGFESLDDSWEPIDNIFLVNPELIIAYLQNSTHNFANVLLNKYRPDNEPRDPPKKRRRAPKRKRVNPNAP